METFLNDHVVAERPDIDVDIVSVTSDCLEPQISSETPRRPQLSEDLKQELKLTLTSSSAEEETAGRLSCLGQKNREAKRRHMRQLRKRWYELAVRMRRNPRSQ